MFRNYLLLLFIVVSFSLFGQKTEKINIESDILKQSREVLIFTPKGYDKAKKYNSIFVFDSQNRDKFDFVCSSLSFAKPNTVDYIVVGVVSPYLPEKEWYRNTEMLPKPDNENTIRKWKGNLGKTDELINFIESELIPYVNKNYNTYSHRIGIGHSNSATMLLYSLTIKPNLFNNIIALSPNLTYDNELITRKYKELNTDVIKNRKFFFISNANESNENGFRNWKTGRDNFYTLIKSSVYEKKIEFKKNEFLKLNHNQSYSEGVLSGLRESINFNYFNFESGKAYLKYLEKYDNEKLSSDSINTLAYENFYQDNNELAIKFINWGIELFPDDDNLYDSKGEFLEYLKDYKTAKSTYKKAINILKMNKNNYSKNDFKERYLNYKKRLKTLSKNNHQ